MDNETSLRLNREVRIASTITGGKQIKSSATTWGELQADLKEHSITFNGMNPIVGETRGLLIDESSTLPEGVFTLFLTPIKTKSGMEIAQMGYKDLKAEIKTAFEQHKELAAQHFNVDKNYTTKGTEVLRGLLITWFAVKGGSVVKEVEPIKEEPEVNFVKDESNPKSYIPESKLAKLPAGNVRKEKAISEIDAEDKAIDVKTPSLLTRIAELEAKVGYLEQNAKVLISELVAKHMKDCEEKVVTVEVQKQAKTTFDNKGSWEQQALHQANQLANKLR